MDPAPPAAGNQPITRSGTNSRPVAPGRAGNREQDKSEDGDCAEGARKWQEDAPSSSSSESGCDDEDNGEKTQENGNNCARPVSSRLDMQRISSISLWETVDPPSRASVAFKTTEYK
jgi:hypothetical protein